ncbi:MAG TPA: hypothetical protein VEW69_00835 [Alphaproteobacteria bacterium]|nr:hypothetical protein [Alphaproteobacteria bacterium]
MANWEQFQVWVQVNDRWELLAAFEDFEVASAVAKNYSTRIRLVHAVYEDEVLKSQDVLAEIGNTRAGSK